jgi:ankyrin repeat protein
MFRAEGLSQLKGIFRTSAYQNVDWKDSTGRTPLSWVAENGCEAVVNLLLEQDNVDVNPKDNDGMTPLSWASFNGYEDVVKLLVKQNGIDLNTRDNTPLSLAAKWGHTKVWHYCSTRTTRMQT